MHLKYQMRYVAGLINISHVDDRKLTQIQSQKDMEILK